MQLKALEHLPPVLDANQLKRDLLETITDLIYPRDYNYLDFLNHTMADCEEGLVVEQGCPLRKCKTKGVHLTFNDLRLHLVNECTKIKIVCNICQEPMRRPFVPYHNC
jgi:hypothetical protein